MLPTPDGHSCACPDPQSLLSMAGNSVHDMDRRLPYRRFMDRPTLRLLGESTALMCVVLVVFVGVGPIMESLYAYGLWPRASVEDAQTWLSQKSPEDSFECHDGSNGWEYICDVVNRPRGGQPHRYKYGVMGSPFGVVGATSIPELKARAYATRASTSPSRKMAATGTLFTTCVLDAPGLPDGVVRERTREVPGEVKAA